MAVKQLRFINKFLRIIWSLSRLVKVNISARDPNTNLVYRNRGEIDTSRSDYSITGTV
jgi:hypothetical protein